MTRRRILAGLLLAMTAAGSAAPAESGDVETGWALGAPQAATVGECGGLAPETVACGFARDALPATLTVHLQAEAEFTGRMAVRVAQGGGAYTTWCDFLGAHVPVCRESRTGTLLTGAPYQVSGWVATVSPADGSEFPIAIGRWRIYVTSP